MRMNQAAVVAEIGRPPLLRIGHHLVQVLDDGIEIERLELGGIVEVRPHRVGEVRIAVQHLDVEGLGPPRAVAAMTGAAAGHRALACALVGLRVHGFLL
jgi:hypothetical protein